MRFRPFALVLAAMIAGTSVLGVVCEVDCGQPVAGSLPCHTASAPHDGAALRGAPHACDHDHSGGSPALLTSVGARDSVATSAAVPSPAFVPIIVPEAHAVSATAMSGSPGLSTRTSRLTALRI